MRKIAAIAICLVAVLMTSPSFAEERLPLGKGNVAVKIGYANFTDEFFSEEDSGLYLGIEGYLGVTDKWYIGGEIGKAFNLAILGGSEVEYVPVELNAKYAIASSPNFIFDIGGGLSYNSTKLKVNPLFGKLVDMGNDWVFGGQAFVDAIYRISWFSIGLNGKYQATENFKDTDVDLSNYRIGLTIGIIF